MGANVPRVEIVRITDLEPDDQNANKGTLRGEQLLDKSLSRLGLGRSVVLDRKRKIIGGNKTQSRAVDLGFEEAILVHTDGTKLVAVVRDDLDLDSAEDGRARELAIADNRVAELNLDWDGEQLAALTESNPDAVGEYFFEDEIDAILERDERERTAKDTVKEREVEVESIWPEIRLRVSPEAYAVYEELQQTIDGVDEAARFLKIVNLAASTLGEEDEVA